MMRPQPPWERMRRRKTVSVTPAIGASTVAGEIRMGPTLYSVGNIGRQFHYRRHYRGGAIVDLNTLDWSKCPGIERVPGKCGGLWCFEGTRLMVYVVIVNLASGMGLEEVAETFAIEPQKIQAVLDFIADNLGENKTEFASSDAHPVG